VLTVVSTLTAMAVPASLNATRLSSVRNAAFAVVDTWSQAQSRAQNGPSPGHDEGRHWGVLLVQQDGEAWVGLVCDDRGTTVPAHDMRQYLPVYGGLPVADATLAPVLRTAFSAGTVIMLDANGDGSYQPLDGSLLWYAQHRSGRPIAPAHVVAGSGRACSPLSLGLGTTQGAEFGLQSLAPGLRVQTLDYVPGERGHAQAIQIFPAGVALSQQQE
jgi:hypothetical protein